MTDLLRIKKLADNISFMRLFYFKNTKSHSQNQNLNLNEQYFNSEDDIQALEVIDSVMAIFLFEFWRNFRTGRSIDNKNRFSFKVLSTFSKMKLSSSPLYEMNKHDSDQEANEEAQEEMNEKNEDDDSSSEENLCENCRTEL